MFFGTFWEHHTWLFKYHTLIISKLHYTLCYSEEIERFTENGGVCFYAFTINRYDRMLFCCITRFKSVQDIQSYRTTVSPFTDICIVLHQQEMFIEGEFQLFFKGPVDDLPSHIGRMFLGIQFLYLPMLQPDKKSHSTEQSQQKNVSTGYL